MKRSNKTSMMWSIALAGALSLPGTVSAAELATPGIVQLRIADLEGKPMSTMPAGASTDGITMLSTKSANFVEKPEYYSSDKKLEVAVKRYEKMMLQLKNWSSDEFIQIVDGQVEITDAAGRATTYKAGDSIVIPRGFNGVWKQLTDISMVTVIYMPGK